MEPTKLQQLKNKLEQELATLELELTDIGKINTQDHYDWSGTPGHYQTGTADNNILADKMDEVQTNEAIVTELESRRLSVIQAINRMERGEYGKCEKCHKEIELDRLEANPAATTCANCNN